MNHKEYITSLKRLNQLELSKDHNLTAELEFLKLNSACEQYEEELIIEALRELTNQQKFKQTL